MCPIVSVFTRLTAGQSGTIDDDVLTAAQSIDVLHGWAGNDTISDGAGAQTLFAGGSGDDVIIMQGIDNGEDADGGIGRLDTLAFSALPTGSVIDLAAGTATDGVDTMDLAGFENVDLSGLTENYSVNGNPLNNIVTGGSGDDSIAGASGHDRLEGGGGEDFIEGQSGIDIISGGSRADEIFGGSDNDILSGGSGNDRVNGGSGADIIEGSADHDLLVGGPGNDRLIGGSGNDTLIGGSDIDSADFAGAVSAVNVNLMNGTAAGVGNDILQGIENIIGSAFDDTLVGDTAANMLDGRGGEDFFDGMSGDDTLIGGSRADEMFGGSFDDSIRGDGGNDRANGGSGDDIIDGGGNNDLLIGGPGADTITGGAGDDDLTGGSGDDVFVFEAASGDDSITGFIAGAGTFDSLDFSALGIAFGNLTIAQQGADTLITAPGGDSVLLLGVTATALDTNDDFVF